MKTKVIYIYGAPAVGKLTTAKALSEITGFKLLHNHLTTDLVRSIFERGNPAGDMYLAELRLEILEIAVKGKVSGIIMTGAHAHDYLYPNGESDEWYAKKLEEITEKYDGEFYGIQLITSTEILLERVVQSDRLEWKKIHDTEVLKTALQKNDFTKPAPIKNNLVINDTNKTAQEVVSEIIEFIKMD